MRAVVVEGPNAVSYREVQAPVVGVGDVLVQSRAAGLCRTDIEMMTGVFTDPRWVRFPVIPGHEWAGTVVEVGADVAVRDVGDRVVCEGMIVCHRCPALPQRRDAVVRAHRGARVHAAGRLRRARRGPRAGRAPPARARLLRRRRPRRAGVGRPARPREGAARRPGEAVGVIGVGTLGALAIALLRLHAPSRIVAYGVREEELELAQQLGATEVVLAGDGTPARGRARPRRRDRGRARRGHAGHPALPARRPGRAARDRRRGTDADPPLRPARRART